MIETLLANMGVTIEQFVLLMTGLGSLIFMAKDFRLGLLILFFSVGVEFIVFYSLGKDVSLYIITLLASFVLLTISLLISYSKKSGLVIQ